MVPGSSVHARRFWISFAPGNQKGYWGVPLFAHPSGAFVSEDRDRDDAEVSYDAELRFLKTNLPSARSGAESSPPPRQSESSPPDTVDGWR